MYDQLSLTITTLTINTSFNRCLKNECASLTALFVIKYYPSC